MSQPFINVHVFDGKLNGLFTPTTTYTMDEKKETFEQLITLLSNPFAITAVSRMIADLNGNSNFQPENNIDATDILMELLEWNDNPDLMISLEEQLADATTLGFCPSGRCTRLLQLWVAFETHNNLDEKK